MFLKGKGFIRYAREYLCKCNDDLPPSMILAHCEDGGWDGSVGMVGLGRERGQVLIFHSERSTKMPKTAKPCVREMGWGGGSGLSLVELLYKEYAKQIFSKNKTFKNNSASKIYSISMLLIISKKHSY